MQNAGLARYQWLRRYDLCREQFTRGAMSCRDAPPIPHSCARTVRCAVCTESRAAHSWCDVLSGPPAHPTQSRSYCAMCAESRAAHALCDVLSRPPPNPHSCAHAVRCALCAESRAAHSWCDILSGPPAHPTQSRSYFALCIVRCAL